MAVTMSHVSSARLAAPIAGSQRGNNNGGIRKSAVRTSFQQKSAPPFSSSSAARGGGRSLCSSAVPRASQSSAAAAAERSERMRTSHAATTSSSSSLSSSSRRGGSLFARASSSADNENVVGGIPERNLRKDLSATEYAELKSWLLKTTAKYGAGLTLYSTLGYGLANGLSAALGTAGSLVYLVLLGQHVDGLKGSEIDKDAYTRNLVYEPVTDVFGMLGGAFGKVGRVYSQALLQKRLLVPVLIAAGTSTFNALDAPFDFNYGPVLLGFLSYKAAVLTKLYDDLKPDIVKAITGGVEEE